MRLRANYLAPLPVISSLSLTSTIPDDRKNVSEDVDDVQVEGEGSEDILLRRDGELVVASNHELSVEHQIEGEEQGTHTRVHDVQDLEKGETELQLCILTSTINPL